MCEDLSAMGHVPSDNDFYPIILGSLSPSYDPYISAVNAMSSILGTSLSPDELMQTITEEYKHCALKSKGVKEENAAFFAGGKGHGGADCWASSSSKEGQGPKRKGKSIDKSKEKETAANEKSKNNEEQEAWM
ncbi:hypothetical protein H0H87_000531, partial [Tephrocybe sp. NHM501043]